MAIDTLGFSKYLGQQGFSRAEAEAHAQAANRFVFPQLAIKADMVSLKADIVELKADMTMRVIAIVGAIDAVLFALLKLT